MATPAGTARAESPAGKTLVKLYLTNVFATSNRRSICFRSDEEIEAVPAESVHLNENHLSGLIYFNSFLNLRYSPRIPSNHNFFICRDHYHFNW